MTLDQLFLRIMNFIGQSSFTAKDFITAFEKLNRDGYTFALNDAGCYRTLNAWISRWYLTSLETRGYIRKLGREKDILTENQNNSRNMLWRQR